MRPNGTLLRWSARATLYFMVASRRARRIDFAAGVGRVTAKMAAVPLASRRSGEEESWHVDMVVLARGIQMNERQPLRVHPRAGETRFPGCSLSTEQNARCGLTGMSMTSRTLWAS
jgi:hypothetical protein